MKKTNKILAFALALLLALSMLPITAFASDAAAASTDSAKSIEISSADQFLQMECGKSYYLTTDITLPAKTGEAYIAKFYGVLDGRGNTVTLQLTATDENSDNLYAGLFGQLGAGVSDDTQMSTVITNLTVKGTIMFDGTDYANAAYIGGLAAKTNNIQAATPNPGYYRSVTLENVNSNVAITCSNVNTNIYVGGLVGLVNKLNATKCSFGGAISVTNTATEGVTYVGGLFGCIYAANFSANTYETAGFFRNVIKNSSNAGDLAVLAAENSPQAVGGIVGLIERGAHVLDCSNTATLANAADIVGKIDGSKLTITVTVADCKGVSDNIIGSKENIDISETAISANKQDKVFIFGNTYTQNDEEKNSTKNLPVYDEADTTTEWKLYECVVPLEKSADFAKIKVDNADRTVYAYIGFFMLDGENGVIDFATGNTDTVYSNYVLGTFNGVLYGNDNAIVGIKFDNKSFINYLAKDTDAVLMNMSMGTEDRPINASYTSGGVGLLANIVTFTNSNGAGQEFGLITGVDVHSNVKVNQTADTIFGLFGGKSYGNFMVCDSNAYGSIALEANSDGKYANIGSFFGFVDKQHKNYQAKDMSLLNCKNFVDISAAGTLATLELGGLVGVGSTDSTEFVNCSNFGDITCKETTATTILVGAFTGELRASSSIKAVFVYGGANYGEISNLETNAVAKIGILTGNYKNAHNYIGFINVNNYSSNKYDVVGGSNTTFPTNGIIDYCDNDAITVNTRDAAAIRINADETKAGLRFKADVSANAAEGLKKAFGSDAVVSYGIIITPTVFEQSAGEFTAAALDKWAEGINGFGEDKAYIDIQVADGNWYEGKTGVIAASVNGLHGAEGSEEVNLFDESFSARAYIKVTVENKVVYTLYGNANDGEVFTDILGKALGDVLYTKDNGETWYTDEACENAADSTKYDFATYTLELSEEGATVKKYSCYTEKQYEDLTTLQDTISAINS